MERLHSRDSKLTSASVRGPRPHRCHIHVKVGDILDSPRILFSGVFRIQQETMEGLPPRGPRGRVARCVMAPHRPSKKTNAAQDRATGVWVVGLENLGHVKLSIPCWCKIITITSKSGAAGAGPRSAGRYPMPPHPQGAGHLFNSLNLPPSSAAGPLLQPWSSASRLPFQKAKPLGKGLDVIYVCWKESGRGLFQNRTVSTKMFSAECCLA